MKDLPSKRTYIKYSRHQVGSYMHKAVVTVSPADTLQDAVNKMSSHTISCVVIVKGDSPIGLITERTVVELIAKGTDFSSPIRKIKLGKFLLVKPHELVTSILKKMRRAHVRRAIVQRGKNLLGIATQTTLLEAYQRLLHQMSTKQEKLFDEATHDDLTMLFNRRYFNNVFKAEIRRVCRYGGLLALVMFDLDHFKKVNDKYGHLTGDLVLRECAHVLRRTARNVDTVARYGGEEFVVLMPTAGTRAARIFAERVRQRLKERDFNFEKKVFHLTISAGVCKWTRGNWTMRRMIKCADTALYKAKHSGRDKVMVG